MLQINLVSFRFILDTSLLLHRPCSEMNDKRAQRNPNTAKRTTEDDDSSASHHDPKQDNPSPSPHLSGDQATSSRERVGRRRPLQQQEEAPLAPEQIRLGDVSSLDVVCGRGFQPDSTYQTLNESCLNGALCC
jgi:hypothetical protein